ncbi:DUF3995 domain-containing protein [Frankia sp. AvcI1]|uniref:DUF3995 domain-containing protein n=1 Tax=Frankia sp. AvcI1 TaxID=573496 RepID=UPI002118B4E3|nr:DUF3995 domain-containing protein [Frankia sp. AvcI1]
MLDVTTERRKEAGLAERTTSAGYAAAVWAGLFALVSLYWALGGTAGIDTVGGPVEDLVRDGASTASALAWGAVVLKAAGVMFALALVQRWGRVSTVLLVGYGGVIVWTELLVVVGVIDAAQDTDWYAFYWHLALWDPHFVVWGILLGIATRHRARRAT